MNCEMAQRSIALAALAPGRAATAEFVEVASATDLALAEFEAEFFAEHPESAYGATRPARDGDRELSDPGPRGHEMHGPGLHGPEIHGTEMHGPGINSPEMHDADIPDDERRALEEHLSGCRGCRAEMAATAAFYRALSSTRQPEPTPSLLARARLHLDATLDNNAHQSAIAHLLQQLSFSAGRLRAAPGLASGLLLVGIVAGGYGGFRAGHAAHNEEQRTLVLEHAPDQRQVIAAISGITREPGSEQVEVSYDRLVPDTLSGSLDDPSIRRLLVLGTEQGADAAVRNDSLDLLASECRNGHQCSGGPVRNALLSALRTDPNPDVRTEALAGLEPYIAEDMRVRDAVLRAVMADKSASVRIEAIRLLTPVEVDSSVRQALHTVAAEDGDPSIRNASQQLLNGMPQVQ